MYVRDPVALSGPSRLANALRIAVNAWVGLMLASMATILLVNALKLQRFPSVLEILQLLLYTTFALALVAIPAWFAFCFGFIKCPCCGESFRKWVALYLIDRQCGNCGYDIQARTRPGDF
jgi:hypothetical protein